MNKTMKIHFWITPILLEKLEKGAEQKGESRNEYINQILINHLELEPVIKWCCDEIKKIQKENMTRNLNGSK